MRICFLNPFGTSNYDDLIHRTLDPSLRAGTELEIRHLEMAPENIDYYAAKHLVEVGVMRAALQVQRDGFDALVIGCCYDPALTQCRELLDIPVVGPLEAALGNIRPFGHRFAVVTDHTKAVPEIADRVRLYGQEANSKGVSCIGWFVDEMIKDPRAVAVDIRQAGVQVMEQTGAETVIVACTIISGCYVTSVAEDPSLGGVSLVDPNIIAVKQAEMLADLQAVGQYPISRAGYYQKHSAHSQEQADEVERLLTEPWTVG
jgi:allantoin racemase